MPASISPLSRGSPPGSSPVQLLWPGLLVSYPFVGFMKHFIMANLQLYNTTSIRPTHADMKLLPVKLASRHSTCGFRADHTSSSPLVKFSLPSLVSSTPSPRLPRTCVRSSWQVSSSCQPCLLLLAKHLFVRPFDNEAELTRC